MSPSCFCPTSPPRSSPSWPPTRPPTPISTSPTCISSRWAGSRPMPHGRSKTVAPPPNLPTPPEGSDMTRTIVESKTKTAVIGFDEPFCVIGERINPTGRKKLAAELEAGDFSTVESDALAQTAAGATVLDINAGVVYNSNPNPNETEPPLMTGIVELVQSLVDLPLCIDSSVPAALEAGLRAAHGRPLLNSVTGEEERLEYVLPLVKKYNVPVVAISNDDTGISEDPDVRFAVAKKIVERAADFGIPAHDIVVDPLVMPVGAMGTAGRQHHLRCVQHLLWPAQPARHQQRLPADGDRGGDDERDHEPDRAAGETGRDRGQEGRGRRSRAGDLRRHGRRDLLPALRAGFHQGPRGQGDGGDPRRQFPDGQRPAWR